MSSHLNSCYRAKKACIVVCKKKTMKIIILTNLKALFEFSNQLNNELQENLLYFFHPC